MDLKVTTMKFEDIFNNGGAQADFVPLQTGFPTSGNDWHITEAAVCRDWRGYCDRLERRLDE